MSPLDVGRVLPTAATGRRRWLPAASVLLGSLAPLLPVIADYPVLPPVGLLLLVAWRLLRPELWQPWAAAPLGLWDDLVSGQPLGSAMLTWSIAFFLVEFASTRLVWRDWKQDWAIGAAATVAVLLLQRIVALPPRLFAVDLWVAAHMLVSVLSLPLATRAVVALDRLRFRR